MRQEGAGGENVPPLSQGGQISVFWGCGGGGGRQLTFMKEQLTMSRMMQPRDQMSDFWLKEKLRASGAIQDF